MNRNSRNMNLTEYFEFLINVENEVASLRAIKQNQADLAQKRYERLIIADIKKRFMTHFQERGVDINGELTVSVYPSSNDFSVYINCLGYSTIKKDGRILEFGLDFDPKWKVSIPHSNQNMLFDHFRQAVAYARETREEANNG